MGMDALIPVVVATHLVNHTIRRSATYRPARSASNSLSSYQCVVARLPSSRPASATTLAPAHTPTISDRGRLAPRRSIATGSSSRLIAGTIT